METPKRFADDNLANNRIAIDNSIKVFFPDNTQNCCFFSKVNSYKYLKFKKKINILLITISKKTDFCVINTTNFPHNIFHTISFKKHICNLLRHF